GHGGRLTTDLWGALPGRDCGALLLPRGAHCRRFSFCPQTPPLVSLCRIRAYLWPLIHEGTQRTTLDTLCNQSATQSDKFLAVTALSRSHAEKPKEPGSRGKNFASHFSVRHRTHRLGYRRLLDDTGRDRS